MKNTIIIPAICAILYALFIPACRDNPASPEPVIQKKFSITVILSDSAISSALIGATISAGGRSAFSDSSGTATLTGLVSGSYALELSKSAYRTEQMQIELNSDTVISRSLIKEFPLINVSCTFNIRDVDCDAPLRNMEVKIPGFTTLLTDKAGNATFPLRCGDYKVSAKNDFYWYVQYAVRVESDTTIIIKMKRASVQKYHVRFIVRDSLTFAPLSGIKLIDAYSSIGNYDITDSTGTTWMNYMLPGNLFIKLLGGSYGNRQYQLYLRADTTVNIFLSIPPPPVMGDYVPLIPDRQFRYKITHSSSFAGDSESSSGTEQWTILSILEDSVTYKFRIRNERDYINKKFHYGVLVDSQHVIDTVYFYIGERKSDHRLSGFPLDDSGAPYYRYYPVSYGEYVNISVGTHPAQGKLQIKVGLIRLEDRYIGNHSSHYLLEKIP